MAGGTRGGLLAERHGGGSVQSDQQVPQRAGRGAQEPSSVQCDGLAHESTIDNSVAVLWLVRALLPVITLFVGKLIIDDVVVLVQTPHKPETLWQWVAE